MSFTDTGFVVRLVSEEDRSYYTTRVLELQNTMVSLKDGQIKRFARIVFFFPLNPNDF